MVNGAKPHPIHCFITGGAGTFVFYLTAPTGIAAQNLNAATIQTSFSIGTDVRLPYTSLGGA